MCPAANKRRTVIEIFASENQIIGIRKWRCCQQNWVIAALAPTISPSKRAIAAIRFGGVDASEPA